MKSPLPRPPLPPPGARWAVMLDVDGTLLDSMDDPRSAVVEPALLELLGELHTALEGALALVSGRELDDIDALFQRPPWAAVGLHGLELRHADGSFRRRVPGIADQTQMRKQVTELAARFEGVRLEDKQRTIVLRCRSDPSRLAGLRLEAKALLPQLPGYELQPGRQSVEFKPVGMDKGRAVRELFRHPTFAGRTPVYVGDGFADEHAFRSVNRFDGKSVRVGNREPTVARYTLANPAEARTWLREVLEAL